MKNLKAFTFTAITLVALTGFAAPKKAQKVAAPAATQQQPAKQIDFAKDVDGLGGNDALLDMANRLNPETRSRIVQDRIVDRNLRLEIGLNLGGIMGGTTYLQTSSKGITADLHITPRWSIGARYYDYSNSLTPEGERIRDNAKAAQTAGAPAINVDIDSPYNAKMAVINWYPIYGKINFFDKAVAQFDVYLLAGGGQIELNSGETSLVTGGLGMGLWMTKHLSARAEIRYQGYQDQITTGPRDIQATTATLGLGWIL